MSGLFKVSSNPHIRSRVATNGLMAAVVIALMPAAGFGIYNFGPRALAVYAVTIASTLLTEYFFGLYKKKQTITDMSAVVTGLLLALNLPVTIPLWMAALGGVFAILVVKMLFGGLGQNFIVQPDIMVICDKSKLDGKRCNGAPDFIIEIVSPGNPADDYIRKLYYYQKAGVREYWIVDPRRRMVTVNCFQENLLNIQYSFDSAVRVGIFDDLIIDFRDLARLLDI